MLAPNMRISRNSHLADDRPRHWPLSLAVVLAVSVQVAFADEDAEDAEGKPTTATISGRVVNEKDEPVEPTRVRLWSFQNKPQRHWKMVAKPPVTPGGEFEVTDVETPVSLLIRTDVEGFAPGWASLYVSEGGPADVKIIVSPPGRVELVLRDSDDRPIAAARLRWMTLAGPNGSVRFGSEVIRDLNLPCPTSDEQGRLVVGELPRGAKLKLGLAHAEFAPVEAVGVPIEEHPEPLKLTMPRGIPLTLQITSPDRTTPLDEVTIDLRHEPFDHPSTTVYESLPVDETGATTLQVEAGSYRWLRLMHPKYVISPALSCNFRKQQFIPIDEQTPVLHFRAMPKIEVRGRVIDAATGEPITDGWVSGEIPNVGPDGNVPPHGIPWMHVDWGETDADGWYTTQLAAGKARISFQGRGFTSETDYLEFDVAADGTTEAPLLEMTPIAPVVGQVIGPDGQPVPEAVVRFRGRHLRWTQPVLTDDEGRFTLKTPWIPQDRETEERVSRNPVVAFHPHLPWVGIEWVELDQPGSLSNVTVSLKEQPEADLTGLIPDELTAWERGDVDDARKSEKAAISLVGLPAPELDGREWLNTSRAEMSLADYRGKYVLLDFWTTWCGPCHGDLPSLKLLRQLYGGENFEIIGVHDNSVSPKKIAAHVQKEGMDYPIVIDHSDGRILREYKSHGISGYPSYILLGPDGRVLIENRTAVGPSLRAFKLELVRQHLLDADPR